MREKETRAKEKNEKRNGTPHTNNEASIFSLRFCTIGDIDIRPLHRGAGVHALGRVVRQTAATCSRREREKEQSETSEGKKRTSDRTEAHTQGEIEK